MEDEGRSLLGDIWYIWRAEVWSVTWVGRLVWITTGLILGLFASSANFYNVLFM